MTDFWHRYRVGITSVLRRCAAGGVFAFCLSLAAAPGAAAGAMSQRLLEAWEVTFEACLAYVETGKRDVFDGWEIAFPGGGVCNGDPVCERSQMTFIPAGRGAVGATEVRVPERVVGDAPGAVVCAPPFQVIYPRDDLARSVLRHLEEVIATGGYDILPDGQDGPRRFAGCAFDAREFEAAVLLRPLDMTFRVTLDADAPYCGKGMS